MYLGNSLKSFLVFLQLNLWIFLILLLIDDLGSRPEPLHKEGSHSPLILRENSYQVAYTYLELRDLKYQVNEGKFSWKFQLVSHFTDPFQYLIRFHILGTSIPIFIKSHHPFNEWNLQVDPITYFKLKISSFIVGIRFFADYRLFSIYCLPFKLFPWPHRLFRAQGVEAHLPRTTKPDTYIYYYRVIQMVPLKYLNDIYCYRRTLSTVGDHLK